ncbi:MAG: integration host factor subunit alpha [Alphaproteobacteria bacterium]|nr:integration host factor subunit alpha [Alphaproteobacteria bacterium]MBE8220898.1 integration host factor subunit alpha [Alphaproteobacteria bacterium]
MEDTKPDTLTRAELANLVHIEIGLPKQESTKIVETLLDEISIALERGEEVKLASFGNFSLLQKKERVGRNPKTGVVVPISPRRVVSFRASQVLKNKVDKSMSDIKK